MSAACGAGHVMRERLSRSWRILATDLSFVVFGIAGVAGTQRRFAQCYGRIGWTQEGRGTFGKEELVIKRAVYFCFAPPATVRFYFAKELLPFLIPFALVLFWCWPLWWLLLFTQRVIAPYPIVVALLTAAWAKLFPGEVFVTLLFMGART